MRAPWRENCLTLTDTGRRACVSITAISYSDYRRFRVVRKREREEGDDGMNELG